MPFAVRDEARIYWRLQGPDEAPAVVLLNSIGTDQSLYDLVVPRLIGDFRLLRIDTRGHGASDAPAGEYSLALLAGDVTAAMDAAGVDKALVCGVSLGGMIAMTLALEAPELVSGLLLACTSAAMDPAFWAQRIATVRAQGLGAIAEAAVARMFDEGFARANPGQAQTIARGLMSMNRDGYLGCAAAIRDMDVLNRLGGVRAPALVLGGERDGATPYEGHGDRIVAALPGARALVLPTGHLACIEDPAAFAAAVRDAAVAT